MASPFPRFLHPFAKPTRTDFIEIARGDGARIYDTAGNEYIDGMAKRASKKKGGLGRK